MTTAPRVAPRVLVVEDEPLIASLVADWLAELGCEVVGPVYSAAEAIPHIELNAPEVALLDVSLGAGDSFSLAAAAREKGVRIAFITGRLPDVLPAHFKGTPLLSKPFDFAAMQTLLQSLLPDAWQAPAAG